MFENRILTKKLLPFFKPRLHKLMQAARPYAMISRNRMQNLARLMYRIERDQVPGDIVETGVARGGSAIVLASLARESRLLRQVWLYDAFELVDHPVATFAGTRSTLFDMFRFDPQSVHLIKGWFAEVLPQHPDRPIALLHVDAGRYEIVKDCLHNLYGRVAPAGWVVIDNYGVCSDCRRAVDELLKAEHLTSALERFNHTQAYFQKPAATRIERAA